MSVLGSGSRAALAVLAVSAVVVAGGCGREAAPADTEGDRAAAAAEFGTTIAERIETDALLTHLQNLQDIADAHDGNRASGTPGYDASVDYVANALRDKGFDVTIPEFEVRVFHSEPGELTHGDATLVARALQYSIGTPPDGVSAPLVPARLSEAPGCAKQDFEGLPMDGAIALVDRGVCPFTQKVAHAAAAGAVGVVIANNVDEERMGGTLGEQNDVAIPVVSVNRADGERLRAEPGPVTLRVQAETRQHTGRNVIAQTTTGDTDNVVMAGAHLDSVPEGPGINDNASGVAGVLEAALQLGSAPPVQNAVRFAFWGAEELGLVGSARYIESLDRDQLTAIAMYLNFDMIGSPNPGYFTYDGDQSAPRDRNDRSPWVPEGSAGIERTLTAYLDAAGKPGHDTSFDGRSDYDSFTLAGIPSGGLFTGGDANMTAEQAEVWGGRAGEPFDPNYHKPEDTIDNIDATALGIHGAGVGYSVGLYAQDLGGRNGVPVPADRTRHVLTGS